MPKSIVNILKKISKNRVVLFIIIAVLAITPYVIYKKTSNQTVTRYVISKVSKGKIEKTVSGSGYITIPDKLEIKPKIGGEVVYVGTIENASVKEGDLLIEIDPTNYQKQVDDAEFSLKMAQLSLEKLISQKEQSNNDLNKYYESAFQDISEIYGGLPSLITSLKNLFETESLIGKDSQKDLDIYASIVSFYRNIPYTKNQQIDSFNKLLQEYYDLFRKYQLLKLPLDQKEFYDFLKSSYYNIKNLFDLVRTNRDIVSTYKDLQDNHSVSSDIPSSTTVSQLTALQSAVTSLNQYLNTLITDINNLDKYTTTLKNYEQDIENQKYIIKQKENALKEAKDNLANCYIRAPFSGIITNFNVKKGDLVSANNTIGTLITDNKIAEITLSEIDAALVKEGQKVILTLDALPDITLEGIVTEVGLIGETSQGVVTYPVKIAFKHSPDLAKVKAGMTVDANIIVEEKTNILVVPSSAVKTRNNKSYVEIPQEIDLKLINQKAFNNQKERMRQTVTLTLKPLEKFVQTGSADENNIEIIDGLKEGDYVIIQTIIPQKKTTVTTRPNPMFNTQFRMPMR